MSADEQEHKPAHSKSFDREAEPLKGKVVDAISEVYDPEIPVNIFALGLIYDIDVNDQQYVAVRMTLTSPMCPVAESLPTEVEDHIKKVEGVSDCSVEITWDPPWSPEMMSEEARLELDMY